MPELPEVETMVRGIRPHLLGRTLTDFRREPCARKPISIQPDPTQLADRISGQTIQSVHRFAKRILIELSSGGLFAIEPRMTGLMLLANPPSIEHLRAVWRFAEPGPHGLDNLWFWDRRGLGTIRYYFPEQWHALTGRFGPDALEITPPQWREALARTARPIKVALLDQKLVAGIGNLYASEILYRARIAPTQPANTIPKTAIIRLARATRRILEDAIAHEGSTLSDGTYRNSLAQAGNYQNAHRVYARENEPCRRCRAPILRIVQAQRSTFYCGSCQAP